MNLGKANLKAEKNSVKKNTGSKSFSVFKPVIIAAPVSAKVSIDADDDKEDAKELLIAVLEARKSGKFTEIISEDLNTVVNFLRNLRFSLTFSEMQIIAQG
jgi:hypothetical protein